MILEVLIATGIAAMFLVALTSLAVQSARTVSVTSQRGEAQYAVYEGVSALRTIAFDDLAVGAGQIAFAAGSWGVEPGTETLANGMTRDITVSEVERDGACIIVASGGTVDPDSLLLLSNVGWTDLGGHSRSVSNMVHRTRFDNPQGDCFGVDEAGMVSVDVSSGEFVGSKQLRRVYIENTGTTAVTIDLVTLTWDNDRTLGQIFMNKTKVWSDAGPGSPSGNQPSGVDIDIVDTVINPSETFEMHKMQFSQDMDDVTMTVTLTFGDGSTYVSDEFEPED
ncbi:hypothetical protein HOI83_03765 [Candidatus Uhrbacteria bacterium]|nr:hypothetical protein [Candidatus Uhrbacteria bacterium]